MKWLRKLPISNFFYCGENDQILSSFPCQTCSYGFKENCLLIDYSRLALHKIILFVL